MDMHQLVAWPPAFATVGSDTQPSELKYKPATELKFAQTILNEFRFSSSANIKRAELKTIHNLLDILTSGRKSVTLSPQECSLLVYRQTETGNQVPLFAF